MKSKFRDKLTTHLDLEIHIFSFKKIHLMMPFKNGIQEWKEIMNVWFGENA
jgi:hypothetical protein